MKHILIIEDDIHIGNLLEETLGKASYKVTRAYSGTEAVYALHHNAFDLILLDLMLPGLSGEEVLKHVEGTPIIVVSAKTDLDNKVQLLLDGAADYITKPFHMKELLARIAVQLRACSASFKDTMLTYDNVRLNTTTHNAMIDDREIKLTRTEYAILKLLMQNPTRITTKSFLLEHMIEDTPDCTESSLKMHISNLRNKLRNANGKDYIEAVWGIGFKLRNE